MSGNRLAELSRAGVSVWLDDLSRARLSSGQLRSLVEERQIRGVTTNPTIFAAALSGGDDYAEQLRELSARGVSATEAAWEAIAADVREACEVLRPVYEAGDGADGRVSIEVDPRLAHDADGTAAEARRLWSLVDKPNLYVKIPATREGLPAISQALSEGVSVNVTLIFGLERYREVMEAFFSGLEAARSAGRDLAPIASVASFFVSRVDTEVDARLEKLGGAEALSLRGKAAVANARLAYRAWQETFDSERWSALKRAGASAQRPLWASTGVKNPEYRDVMYVEELVAADTVNTLPEATLEAFADHGRTRPDAGASEIAAAEETWRRLGELGVDYEEVTALLEQQGVRKFSDSWDELLAAVSARLQTGGGSR